MKIGIIGAVLMLSLGSAGCQAVTYPQNSDDTGAPLSSLPTAVVTSTAPADVFDQTGTADYDSPTFPLDPTKSYLITLKIRFNVQSCDPRAIVTDGQHEYHDPWVGLNGSGGDISIFSTWILRVGYAGNYRIHLSNVSGCPWVIQIAVWDGPTASPS